MLGEHGAHGVESVKLQDEISIKDVALHWSPVVEKISEASIKYVVSSLRFNREHKVEMYFGDKFRMSESIVRDTLSGSVISDGRNIINNKYMASLPRQGDQWSLDKLVIRDLRVDKDIRRWWSTNGFDGPERFLFEPMGDGSLFSIVADADVSGWKQSEGKDPNRVVFSYNRDFESRELQGNRYFSGRLVVSRSDNLLPLEWEGQFVIEHSVPTIGRTRILWSGWRNETDTWLPDSISTFYQVGTKEEVANQVYRNFEVSYRKRENKEGYLNFYGLAEPRTARPIPWIAIVGLATGAVIVFLGIRFRYKKQR
jgi:hypothetical protein